MQKFFNANFVLWVEFCLKSSSDLILVLENHKLENTCFKSSSEMWSFYLNDIRYFGKHCCIIAICYHIFLQYEIRHLARTKIFSKTNISYPLIRTYMYMCVTWVKKCLFFGNIFVRTKWMILCVTHYNLLLHDYIILQQTNGSTNIMSEKC